VCFVGSDAGFKEVPGLIHGEGLVKRAIMREPLHTRQRRLGSGDVNTTHWVARRRRLRRTCTGGRSPTVWTYPRSLPEGRRSRRPVMSRTGRCSILPPGPA